MRVDAHTTQGEVDMTSALRLVATLVAALTAQVAAAADPAQTQPARLVAGVLYELAVNAGELSPRSSKTCNAASVEELCLAPRGSIFEVVRADSSSGAVVVRFLRIPDQELFTLPKARRIDSKAVYEAKLDALADASNKYEAALTGRLRAVVIPAKLYTSNWQQGANPTLGVAFSFTPKREPLNPLEFLASIEFGMGFNQIAVDTVEKSEERTGLSIFFGYNFRDLNDKVGLGVYLGRDFVRLKPNEEFAGTGRRHRTWIGLVLSTDIAK
jgi:hypothetical protein